MIRKGTVGEQKYVASLIIRRLRGEELPPGAQALLDSWAQRSPKHQATYDALTDGESVFKKLEGLLKAGPTSKKTAYSKQMTGNEASVTGDTQDNRLQPAATWTIVHGKFSKRKKSTPARSKHNVNSLKN